MGSSEADPYADLREPGKVCPHGSLVRKCEHCWSSREIALKDAELATLRAKLAEVEGENKQWRDFMAAIGVTVGKAIERPLASSEKQVIEALLDQTAKVRELSSSLSAYRESVAEVLAAFETTYYIRDEQPPHPDDRAELRRRAAMKNLKAALDAAKGDKST